MRGSDWSDRDHVMLRPEEDLRILSVGVMVLRFKAAIFNYNKFYKPDYFQNPTAKCIKKKGFKPICFFDALLCLLSKLS